MGYEWVEQGRRRVDYGEVEQERRRGCHDGSRREEGFPSSQLLSLGSQRRHADYPSLCGMELVERYAGQEDDA